jgi:hypothetical protein
VVLVGLIRGGTLLGVLLWLVVGDLVVGGVRCFWLGSASLWVFLLLQNAL